jgi:hypothetical protein
MGCTQHALLGEDRCYGEHTICSSDAPDLTLMVSPMGDHTFDLIAQDSVAPNWLRSVPCQSSCLDYLASGPEGNVWEYHIEFPGHSGFHGTLFAVNESGQFAQSFLVCRRLRSAQDAAASRRTERRARGRHAVSRRRRPAFHSRRHARRGDR